MAVVGAGQMVPSNDYNKALDQWIKQANEETKKQSEEERKAEALFNVHSTVSPATATTETAQPQTKS